jgi:hypothetical protein
VDPCEVLAHLSWLREALPAEATFLPQLFRETVFSLNSGVVLDAIALLVSLNSEVVVRAQFILVVPLVVLHNALH